MRPMTAMLILALASTACDKPAEPADAPAESVPAPRVPSSEAIQAAKAAGVAPMNRMGVAGPYLDGEGAFVFVDRRGAISRLDVKAPSIQYGDVKSGKLELVMTVDALYTVDDEGKGALIEEPLNHSNRLARGPHYESSLEVFHDLAEPLRAKRAEGAKPPATIDTDASWIAGFSTIPGRMKDMNCERREVDGFFVGCF